ncbi:methyltransferase domain-containing protein [Nocardia uniformis]|uniref:Methyltransferase domain-containing protein n=1 Tax=Nocardia uniformis TaxID=53432 RepID=A0A849BUF3_9NOCA|nr:methyltransferase domain-containing protein [Nocardia uniformis]
MEPVARLTGTTRDTALTGPVAASPGPAERLFATADLLACPECGQDLTGRDRTLRCSRGHSFDLAKQGYVSLLTGASTKMTGDTPAMLDARAAFQSAGHFAPIAAALASAAASGSTLTTTSATRLASTLLPSARADLAPGAPAGHNLASHRTGPAVLEIGAGTGYYLAAVLDAVPEGRGIALDVAKPAARRAARAHVRAGSVLADAWTGLPIRDGVLDTVFSVFAPRNADEVARVLAPDGRFIIVTPTERHLGELIEPLDMVRVDATKARRLADSLADRFELVERELVEFSMSLSHNDIANVVGMGPSAFHADAQLTPRIAALPPTVVVTASVTVAIYRPRG